MYRGYDDEFGLGPRIYRSPDEIRNDIERVKYEIENINCGINIRELMLEMLSNEENLSPDNIISELESLVSAAEEALAELSNLNEELSLLEEELYEVKCEIGI